MNEILGKVIDLLRENGVEMDSPYDFENWVFDNATHTQLFATGKFKREDDA